jgi:Metallo-beta-lactamase superfamily
MGGMKVVKKRPLAWAATGLMLAWLARRFCSPALPDPGPLPASVPIPHAEPPDDMELIAVPTGVNHRVAAYAYRGGSVFDRRDFYIGAALIKHPQGDLLVDAGFGRDIAWQVATMPRYFQAITRYQLWKPAADQLEAAGYDFGRLKAILLTHAHWDHMSGLPDFPGLPIMVTARDKAFFGKPQPRRRFGPQASAPRSPKPRSTGRSSASRAGPTSASPAATTSMATGQSSVCPHRATPPAASSSSSPSRGTSGTPSLVTLSGSAKG